MRPRRPAGTSLDVKLSSYKTLRSFLEQLQNEKLLSLEPGLADPLVNKIHYDHPDFGLDLPEKKKVASKVTLSNLVSLRPSWMQNKASAKPQIIDSSSVRSLHSIHSTVEDASSVRSTSDGGCSLITSSSSQTQSSNRSPCQGI